MSYLERKRNKAIYDVIGGSVSLGAMSYMVVTAKAGYVPLFAFLTGGFTALIAVAAIDIVRTTRKIRDRDARTAKFQADVEAAFNNVPGAGEGPA